MELVAADLFCLRGGLQFIVFRLGDDDLFGLSATWKSSQPLRAHAALRASVSRGVVFTVGLREAHSTFFFGLVSNARRFTSA
jgi:hypothetical protein